MTDYDARVERLRAGLEAQELDGALLLPGANFTYYTGIVKDQSERPLLLFLPRTGTAALLVPRLEETALCEALPYGAEAIVYTDEDGYEKAFAAFGRTLSGRRIGVELRSMRLLEARQIEAHAFGCRLEAFDAALSGIRMVKDDGEIAAMREAIRITQEGLSAVLERISLGQSEFAVARALEAELLRCGSDGLGFDPLIVSGPRAALPHAGASDRALVSGDSLILDFGARHGAYAADLTRTVAVGTSDPDWREIYDVVLAANTAAREAAGPGTPAGEVDRAARAVVEKAGYGDYFTHRTGHGLGLEIHEPPYIVAGSRTALERGMTFTIEPGIYLAGKAGVRIEDDVMITSEGCESLTTFARELTAVALPA